MNIFRKACAAVLTAAVLLSCGCGSSPAISSVKGTGSVQKNPQNSTANGAAFSVPQNSFSVDDDSEITYFGNQDISAAAELFAKNNGGTVVAEKPSGDYINKLSEKIFADNSPDLCDKVDNTYPYLISINMYEDLTNYIDITAPQWEDITGEINFYSVRDARYFYPTKLKVMPQFLIYLKNDFVACGNIPDPEKLWLRGEWTLTAFLEGADGIIESSVSTADTLMRGDHIIDNFMASAGSWLNWYQDNYYEQPYAERTFNILTSRAINHTRVTNAADDTRKFVFLSGDESTLAQLRKAGLTVGIVPYPRYDKFAYDDESYYCRAASEGFLVPKGAKNIQSAASFINCSRLSAMSAEQKKDDDQKLVESGLLRSDVEWLNTLRSSDKMTPVCVDLDCFDENTNKAVHALFTDGDGTWEDAVASYSPIIDSAVEKINAVVE